MRRVVLLVLGVCGSIGAAVLLCCSAAAGQPFRHNTSSLQFPFRIAGTDLVVMGKVCYDGPFVEDGSDREVVGVDAVLIRNVGQRTVEEALVTLSQKNNVHNYRLFMLPPGATVLVLESDASPYSKDAYIACTGNVQLIKQSPCNLSAQITLDDRIVVSNTSTQSVRKIAVCYKTYDSTSGMYLGGITYKTTADNILPGERRTLEVYRVVYGYTQIVGIEDIS